MANVQLAGLQAQMDLMNFKKQDSLGCDEAGAPEYSYAAFSSGAAAGAGPGGVGASGSGASGGAGAFISSTGVGGAAKQDEPSVKGLWRRAFNKLKTKDKDKFVKTSGRQRRSKVQRLLRSDIRDIAKSFGRVSVQHQSW
uniref:Signal recognition particle protein n=1 Tax=Macrostomum lignano TaxID=282301 RepID=A0A1I8I6P3_9PLAT